MTDHDPISHIENKAAAELATYAVIELFGHSRVAGLITESPLGGGALIRVSVPAHGNNPAHTRDINPKAVYAINYCDESAMLMALPGCSVSPVISLIGQTVAEKMREEYAERERRRNALTTSFSGDATEQEEPFA